MKQLLFSLFLIGGLLTNSLFAHTVTFTVTSYGDPIVGAIINIDNNELETDSAGQAQIELPDGTYAFTMNAPGLAAHNDSVTVAGQAEEVAITTQAYTVYFNVTHNQMPVDSATITFDGIYLKLTTNENGIAQTAFGAGEYTFHVEKEGLTTADGTFTIDSSDIDFDEHDTTIYVSMLGTTELEEQQINISPNPTSDIINIKLPGTFTVKLFDNIGKIARQKKVQNNGVLNIQTLPDGIYFVKIEDAENQIVKKIIKSSR